MEPQLVKAQGFCKGLQMHCISHTCMHTHPPPHTPTHTLHTHAHKHTLSVKHVRTQTEDIFVRPLASSFCLCVMTNIFKWFHPHRKKGGVVWDGALWAGVGGRGCCLRWRLVWGGGGVVWDGALWAGVGGVYADSLVSKSRELFELVPLWAKSRNYFSRCPCCFSRQLPQCLRSAPSLAWPVPAVWRKGAACRAQLWAYSFTSQPAVWASSGP